MQYVRGLGLLICGMCGLAAAAEHHGVVKFGGLPLPGASVTATRDGKRVSAITDQQGAYTFADLADGTWTLRVEMQCFTPIEREVAVAPAAPSPEWELKMLPLAEIRASAPPPPPPSPATPAPAAASTPGAPVTPAATVAKNAKKPKLPKGVPAPTAANTPGGFQRAEVKQQDAAAKEPDSKDAPAEMNQAPADGFLINGSVNNGAATPFAQSAAFGNFRKKPGSLYNGSLGLVFDNSFWDARAFSLTGQDTAKPSYSRLRGMASFGGPLKIPHLPQKDPANITINYQWRHNRDANTQSVRVPTAAERLGDFSQSLDALGVPVKLLDPTTGQPIPGRQLPAGSLSKQALSLLQFYPLPNFTSTARYNYQVPLVDATHQDSMQARVSKTLTKKDQVFGTFGLQSTRTDSNNIFGFLDTGSTLGMMANVNWMHRFGMKTFANLGVQYSRQGSTTTPFFANRINVSGLAGITGNNQDPVNYGPPALSFSSGITGLNDAKASSQHYQTTGTSGSLYRSYGGHNIQFGGDYRRQQFNLISQQDPRGSFTFTGAATGSDFAGFLLGIPDAVSIAYGNADKYFRSATYDAYMNDDFRATSKLTINWGIRWNYSSPITERYGRLVNLDTTPAFSAVAPVVASNPNGSITGRTYPSSLVAPTHFAVEPRVGVSWRPLLASSMVVRAGYGIYHDTSIYLPIAIRMAQQSPLSTNLSIANSAANPLTLANAFHTPANTFTNTFAVDPDLRLGYSQNWQLSLQRDLPGSLVMTASYNGTKGTRAQQQFLPNTYPTGAVNPCPACPSGYTYLTSNGNSTRESGQLQLRRRLHSGVTAQMNYTYSKSIDDASLGGRGQGSGLVAQDWLNLAGERGRSNFDQRHLLTGSVQYTTGMGLKGGTLMDGWRGRLIKDWTFSTNTSVGSGLPQTPVFPSIVRGTGTNGSIRPNYTGADLYAAPPGLYLNPAALSAPSAGQWGNAGRNSITGPNQFSLDASMARTFRFSDRVSADFRLEAENALNHVNYKRWNVVTTSSQFGLPSSTSDMRTLQATMRVRF